MSEFDARALLSKKKKYLNQNGQYLVTVTCSACRHSRVVTFSGWSGLGCGGCGATMERTPYRKAKPD